MKNGHFEINLEGKLINVRRHFEFNSGTIDLDIRFTPEPEGAQMTLKDIHTAVLKIGISHLQELLTKAEASS